MSCFIIFLPVVLISIYPLFTDSIISTQLPSRPGLNRGANSGTSGLTSCEKRTRVKWVDGQTGAPRAVWRWIQTMPSTVSHTKTQQTPNSPVWLVPFTCNLTVFQHDRCLFLAPTGKSNYYPPPPGCVCSTHIFTSQQSPTVNVVKPPLLDLLLYTGSVFSAHIRKVIFRYLKKKGVLWILIIINKNDNKNEEKVKY